MPPKKKVIPKVKAETTVTQSVDTKCGPKLINEVNIGKMMKVSDPASSECQKTVVAAKTEEKKENIFKVIIRFDQISNKSEEQILEERRIKFGLAVSINAQMNPNQSEKQLQSNNQDQDKDSTNKEVELLLKNFSEEERSLFRERMCKFGLTENDLRSIIANQINSTSNIKYEEKYKNRKEKRDGKEHTSFIRSYRLNRQIQANERRKIEDSMSQPKKTEIDHSRSREAKHQRYTSKYHHKYND